MKIYSASGTLSFKFLTQALCDITFKVQKKKWPVYSFSTLSFLASFLARPGRNQATSACCFTQTVHKPVKQKRIEALRAYCPNIYTVGSVLTICYFLQYLLSHKIVNFLGSESCA